MMTNNPNANLIEAMKEKLPLKGQLADMLMDTLYIGKEAVYRRLRGEVPFTLQESALISRKLGISLDKIIGLSFKSNAMFNINIVDYDDPFESFGGISNSSKLLQSIYLFWYIHLNKRNFARSSCFR